MEKSPTIQNLAKALIQFHNLVDTVKKDAKNPFFKSKYASLSNILDTIDQPLIQAGLTFCQFPAGDHGLTTILIHAESGEYISANYTMKPAKDDPQGIGSAITYQRRYALAAVLGLNIDEDDDGNAASNKTTWTSKESAARTSMHNHSDLEKNSKPLISNAQFKQLIERVKKGDYPAADKAVEIFSFAPEQSRILEQSIPQTYKDLKQ